jgi:NAD+ kinase
MARNMDYRDSTCAAPRRPETIALIGKHKSQESVGALIRLGRYLRQRGVTVYVEAETAARIPPADDLPNWIVATHEVIGAQADVAIVIGGDGTMLGAARQLARNGVPLVGVNQGTLGFMTDIALADMLSCMDDLLDGRFVPERRMLLDAEVLRTDGSTVDNLALNDVVADKGPIGRLLELELFINDEFIYKLRADGLIVATPTGSTAYALAANGPILHPSHSGIAIVPLCPHSLTNRPVVVGDQSELELRVANIGDPRVHFDGQVTVDLKQGDVVRIRRSAYSTCFLHPPGYSYFAMLRQKLHWSERPAGAN